MVCCKQYYPDGWGGSFRRYMLRHYVLLIIFDVITSLILTGVGYLLLIDNDNEPEWAYPTYVGFVLFFFWVLNRLMKMAKAVVAVAAGAAIRLNCCRAFCTLCSKFWSFSWWPSMSATIFFLRVHVAFAKVQTHQDFLKVVAIQNYYIRNMRLLFTNVITMFGEIVLELDPKAALTIVILARIFATLELYNDLWIAKYQKERKARLAQGNNDPPPFGQPLYNNGQWNGCLVLWFLFKVALVLAGVIWGYAIKKDASDEEKVSAVLLLIVAFMIPSIEALVADHRQLKTHEAADSEEEKVIRVVFAWLYVFALGLRIFFGTTFAYQSFNDEQKLLNENMMAALFTTVFHSVLVYFRYTVRYLGAAPPEQEQYALQTRGEKRHDPEAARCAHCDSSHEQCTCNS